MLTVVVQTGFWSSVGFCCMLPSLLKWIETAIQRSYDKPCHWEFVYIVLIPLVKHKKASVGTYNFDLFRWRICLRSAKPSKRVFCLSDDRRLIVLSRKTSPIVNDREWEQKHCRWLRVDRRLFGGMAVLVDRPNAMATILRKHPPPNIPPGRHIQLCWYLCNLLCVQSIRSYY